MTIFPRSGHCSWTSHSLSDTYTHSNDVVRDSLMSSKVSLSTETLYLLLEDTTIYKTITTHIFLRNNVYPLVSFFRHSFIHYLYKSMTHFYWKQKRTTHYQILSTYCKLFLFLSTNDVAVHSKREWDVSSREHIFLLAIVLAIFIKLLLVVALVSLFLKSVSLLIVLVLLLLENKLRFIFNGQV